MSYTWITPKTDWTLLSKFAYTDYNRIRNNLLYINDKANELFPEIAKTLDLGNPKTSYTDSYLPSEFTAFEDALESFTRVGKDVNVGVRNFYSGNNSFIMADALNRLESCCLRWKEYLDSAVYIPVTSLYASPTPVTIHHGETKTFTVVVTPSNATKRNDWEAPQVNPFIATKIGNTMFTLKDSKGVAGQYQQFRTISDTSDDLCKTDVPYRTKEATSVDYAVIVYENPIIMSNRITLNLPSTGSYFEKSSNNYTYLLFQLIGNGIDGTNVSTLLNVGTPNIGTVWGAVRDDRNAEWRPVIEARINAFCSTSLKNALLSVSKTVHTSKDTVASYSSKYHLLAANEVGMTDSHITTLGNKTYPYLINNGFKFVTNETSAYRFDYGHQYYMTRSLWDKGSSQGLPPYDGVYETMLDNTYGNKTMYAEDPTVTGTLCPMVFVSKTTHVVLENTAQSYNYYSIDWTGQSNLTLADIPLGSYVYDSRGARS